MNVPAQLTYSHGYFVKFPHTDADIIAHLLFVFVIHMRQQVKHEMKSHKTRTGYILPPLSKHLPQCFKIQTYQ